MATINEERKALNQFFCQDLQAKNFFKWNEDRAYENAEYIENPI